MVKFSEDSKFYAIDKQMLKSKAEVTELYEDPTEMERYHRNILMDYRPDKPMFEEDKPRYETMGAHIIRNRFYADKEEPFVEGRTNGIDAPDPRHWMEEPQDQTSQMWGRVGHIKRFNALTKYPHDMLYQTPEHKPNPIEEMSYVINTMPHVKQNMIFDDSKMTKNIGAGAYEQPEDSIVPNSVDEKRRYINNLDYERSNVKNITPLSTILRSEGDQTMKVAKYGMMRGMGEIPTGERPNQAEDIKFSNSQDAQQRTNMAILMSASLLPKSVSDEIKRKPQENQIREVASPHDVEALLYQVKNDISVKQSKEFRFGKTPVVSEPLLYELSVRTQHNMKGDELMQLSNTTPYESFQPRNLLNNQVIYRQIREYAEKAYKSAPLPADLVNSLVNNTIKSGARIGINENMTPSYKTPDYQSFDFIKSKREQLISVNGKSLNVAQYSTLPATNLTGKKDNFSWDKKEDNTIQSRNTDHMCEHYEGSYANVAETDINRDDLDGLGRKPASKSNIYRGINPLTTSQYEKESSFNNTEVETTGVRYKEIMA